MSSNSSIEWTDATWNPVRGCSIVSKGCTNCYAMKFAHRFSGAGKAFDGLTMLSKAGPVWNGKIMLVPDVLGQPLRWRRGRRIFVNSMSDLFHEDVPFEFIASVFAIMGVTTRHTYQILTKRPERMVEFFEWAHKERGAHEFAADDKILQHWPKDIPWDGYDNCGPLYPYENVHIGVSIEDQSSADKRIKLLKQIPAAVRWLSMEPLLENTDIQDLEGGDNALATIRVEPGEYGEGVEFPCKPDIDWVVIGGESGPGARPFNIEWARTILRDCRHAGVPCFVKQLGSRPHGNCSKCNGKGYCHTGSDPDWCEKCGGAQYEFLNLKDTKGGDITEWPEDLRVREFPNQPIPETA